MSNTINIKNRKAYFEYEILEKYVAGMQLLGSEIKSIRNGKASIGEGYCYFKKHELFAKNLTIAEYDHSNQFNHDPKRDRKLLLKKQELEKLEKKIQDVGLTITPLRLFISGNGFAKLEIGLAKGKKLYDKREDLKKKDLKRQLSRKDLE